MNRLKYVCVLELHSSQIPDDPKAFLKTLESALRLIPDTVKAKIEFDAFDNYGEPDMEMKVSYYREETKQEEEEREKSELSTEKANRNNRLKMYQELKKEFGD